MKMKKFHFGHYFQMYGSNCVEVPENFTLEQAMEYVKNNWGNIELPSDRSYVTDSDEPDFEGMCEFEEVE